MPGFELTVGNYNLSSWSLRPWLVMKELGVPFSTKRIELGGPTEKSPEVKAVLRANSPSSRVPVLRHDDLVIWDSLAICEYLAERFPERHLWPSDEDARATARSVAAEMHSGFLEMRMAMLLNMRASTPLKQIPDNVREQVERVKEIWRHCRRKFGSGGTMLFGSFSIADAMYAPVVSRFTTYGVDVDPTCRAYMDAIWALPAMQEWLELARQES